jgi:signal transduction histidine kinase/CHASE3 domain sensor protein
VRILKSALFWRILLSSLLVVAVLGVGLNRANAAHAELEKQFERLVQHDLKLAYDAERLRRLMADLETGKRGYLLTGNDKFLEPYEAARTDLASVLTEAKAVAEDGMEDERVNAFERLIHEWIEKISEPQIAAKKRGQFDQGAAEEGKALTDDMRRILSDLQKRAIDDADDRQQAAFESASDSQKATRGVLLFAIIIALGSGAWIARDIAGTTARLEEALGATGRLERLEPLADRRDELGAVGKSLVKMNALLLDKDASLRATLAERERAVAELTRANEDLAARDASARAYAEFVRELKTLDMAALAKNGLQSLARLADAQIAVVYLLDDADRLVPIHAVAADGRSVHHGAFGADGLPKLVTERREAAFLRAEELGAPLPDLDLGIGKAPLRWVFGYPVALGDEGAGAMVLGGIHERSDSPDVRDAARQLAVALHNAWTHDRLRDKSVALAEQGERLTRANKVKTEFLASMSHELRTPLSAILGFADLLTTSPKEQLSPRARESLERIKRNGEHLLSLINDVLDLAKAEAGRVEVRLATVNVGHLARACLAEVESLRQGKELKLAADVEPGDGAIETTTDAQRVRQILLNLLSNAIKFTDRGEVVLGVRATANEIQVSVRDTGIGIATHALKELFQDFHQLDAGDGRRYEGTGVGLALSRRLARALGGEIEVRSTEGVGSTFTLVLPRVASQPSADTSPPSMPPPMSTGALQ